MIKHIIDLISRLDKKTDELIENDIISLIIIVIVLASPMLVILNEDIKSTGAYNGQIYKVEQVNLIWTTYKVYFNTEIIPDPKNTFCLDNMSLLPAIENYSKSRQTVTIYFKDELVAPWKCISYNTGIITRIET